MFDRSLFDQARGAVLIEDLAGRVVQLVRAGSERRGQCPFCGAGKAKSASAPFSVKPVKQTWTCYVCDLHGDVVDFEQQLNGGTPVEAARRLVGVLPAGTSVARVPARPKAPEGPTAGDRIAAEILKETRSIDRTLVERYAAARGIPAEVMALAAPRLRFHPNAKWGWDDARRDWLKAPAIVLEVVIPGPDGSLVSTGGVHCTYLARDGRGKTALSPARKMWGPQGADGKRGVAWLYGDPRSAPMARLTVGEGWETTLSRVALYPTRWPTDAAMATLSLDRLQGGFLKDDDGCIDAFDPQPDPARPPATWPGRWNAVIAVDRDMSPIRIKARTGRGKPCDFELGGEARAQICARFAVRGWKTAGAYSARAEAPKPGMDFNDELRRRQARAEAKSGAAA